MNPIYNTDYYQYIVDIILSLHSEEFVEAKAGHCMKITGLADEQLFILLDAVRQHYPHIDSYIISEEQLEAQFISATKLIELRNNQLKPILILIPANSRTAAEDSYGNATFKDLSLDNIDKVLVDRLMQELPLQLKRVINTIFELLKVSKFSNPEVLKYLLVLKQHKYSQEAVGKYLYILGILPDLALLNDVGTLRSRIILNQKSINILSTFTKSIYERVDSLEIEKNTIQKSLVSFFKNEPNLSNRNAIVSTIASTYSDLMFDKWPIPILNYDELKLEIISITSNNFAVEEGHKVLRAVEGRNTKVNVKFTTTPPPNEFENLKHFKVILMAADGFGGEEIVLLRKFKNSNASSKFRSADVELNSNTLEEMTYFLKVVAEDDKGYILNNNDDYLSVDIQEYWVSSGKTKESRNELNYKLKSDSEDFHFYIESEVETNSEQRKDKLQNLLQAHFKYNIDKLKNGDILEIPEASDSSNIWLNDSKPKLNSTFYINYGPKHNYQIILSSKLRYLEDEILRHGDSLGYLNVKANSNITSLNFDSVNYEMSSLNQVVPDELRGVRSLLFEFIKTSNSTENGIVETTNIASLKSEIQRYLELYSKWIHELNENIKNTSVEAHDEDHLKLLFAEVQFLDLIKLKTKLPTGESIDCILLSPLHPLRLAWHLSLIEQFEDWYGKTMNFKDHIKEWAELQKIFLGDLNPSNNPFVFIDPQNFDNYEYLGEITFGWGMYINTKNKGSDDSLTPKTHQIKQYISNILNIPKTSYTSGDVTKNLIIRHLRNYLQQHPYVDKLVLNLFNVGDADKFAEAFIDISKYHGYENIKFEVRLFKSENNVIEPGLGLKELINPENNITEEAEAFSQASINRLFPKLRFSINNIMEYLSDPERFNAHLSFIINPFSPNVSLVKKTFTYKNDYLNGLIYQSQIDTSYDEKQHSYKWTNYYDIGDRKLINDLFTVYQKNIACTLAAHETDSLPSIELRLSSRDNVLISHLHENSDWVITFDKYLGPQIFDQPSEGNSIPFLLDYVPGEEISGVSSFLTTKPNEEIFNLISPHFEKFGLDLENEEDRDTIYSILEDVRALSSSLILQLNSTKNKAFEVIGSAFAKRVLEKKNMLSNAFLIPIDLHQNLFENLDSKSKSRADNLFVSIDVLKREINCSILEIKCRSFLSQGDREELKMKMLEQIENTILALKTHFDPNNYTSKDRLDREIKNKEFKNLLSFYIDRAFRYRYLDENTFRTYQDFIQTLDNGFNFKFNKVGFIFDFSFDQKHLKQIFDDNTTIFTFGEGLIQQILDKDSDLNTQRLEDIDLDKDLVSALAYSNDLEKFVSKYNHKLKVESIQKQTVVDCDSNLSVEKDNNYEGDTTLIIPLASEEVNDRAIEDNGSIVHEGTAEDLNSNLATVKEDSIELSYDIMIGKTSDSTQYGILGTTIHNKKIALDLSETNTVSLFGVQGGGKSYTIGTISEMVLKQVNHVNKLRNPLAGVIFHYSESMDYDPEFTSMIYANDVEREVSLLKERYGADPEKLEDVIILTPNDKVEERQRDFPSIEVLPISFNSKELNVQDWMFLLGAIGNESSYIKQLKAIMKEMRRNITLDGLKHSVEDSVLLSNTQKALAKQRLKFAEEYIDDNFFLKETIKPGRLVIVDLRDEFIEKDEALGLFVIMLNIFSGVKEIEGKAFNKFIVFDEAHKYMDNKDLTNNIVTAIREMRHKGVSIMIASQDPPSLPNEIIELSSVVLVHKFNSPQWLKHIQKSITQLSALTPNDMSMLKPGEGFLWSSKATDIGITNSPQKISTRPRFTKHGGATLKADR